MARYPEMRLQYGNLHKLDWEVGWYSLISVCETILQQRQDRRVIVLAF